MIILDTNVISEMMKKSPSANVIAWIDQQKTTQLYLATITIAEISYGINALAESSRQRALENAFEKVIQEAFKHRILDFDTDAAHHYGKIMSYRKKRGRPLGLPDGQIAAIALTHKASIATRNIRDFIDCGLELINPFE